MQRILNSNSKSTVADPNTFNNHFIGNVIRLTGNHAAKQDELFNMVETANIHQKIISG